MNVETVLIVEDISEAMTSLIRIVQSAFPEARLETARSVKEARFLITQRSWSMALVDIGLPDGSGLDLVRLFSDLAPETVCVVSTVLGDDAHIVAALSAGAQGYILKGQPEQVLLRQLMQIQHGVPPLSPTIARRIMEHFQRTGPVDTESNGLTGRELEVLSLLAKGLRNADVAVALELAESTIATHIKSIYRKLGISSRAEAALHATRLGLA
ncbi:LuxR C-terminal-related transcriptional regulator [Devosia sp. Naph2]|uniref:LuxR C-terminal-related transcriptional regulator n=1 Tax=Devosia polycyclovorans TaxID=3345148 RepID=UPI0035CF8BF5